VEFIVTRLLDKKNCSIEERKQLAKKELALIRDPLDFIGF
jgi:hypothetical protein